MYPSILIFVLLSFGVVFDFLGPYWATVGFNVGFKSVLGSTHVVEPLSFSMIPRILTCDFDLIFG